MGRRRVSDLMLLWLWCRPAAAAPIQPLAWEPPCAAGVPLKKKKKERKKKEKKSEALLSVDDSLHEAVTLAT